MISVPAHWISPRSANDSQQCDKLYNDRSGEEIGVVSTRGEADFPLTARRGGSAENFSAAAATDSYSEKKFATKATKEGGSRSEMNLY